jgi:hypothetical protein
MAEYLLGRGADIDYVPLWEPKTPLDASLDSGSGDLVEWLRGVGARSAKGKPST